MGPTNLGKEATGLGVLSLSPATLGHLVAAQVSAGWEAGGLSHSCRWEGFPEEVVSTGP